MTGLDEMCEQQSETYWPPEGTHKLRILQPHYHCALVLGSRADVPQTYNAGIAARETLWCTFAHGSRKVG